VHLPAIVQPKLVVNKHTQKMNLNI
jgi:hypothetical protein